MVHKSTCSIWWKSFMKSNQSNEERILETSKFALDRSKCSVISTPSWQVNYHIYYFMEDILIFLTWDISLYSPGWPVTQLCSPPPSITSCPSLPCPLPHRSYSPSLLSFLSFCFSLASTWKHTCCIHFLWSGLSHLTLWYAIYPFPANDILFFLMT